jgi:phenylalanyl-tRNA synthetase beta chain
MKFSYNWLRELTGITTEPNELGQLITMKTAECEEVEHYAPHLAHVTPARVLSVEKIPGSHNRKAIIDAGHYGRRTVVCGAPNCRAGMTTLYVPAGAMLGALEIKKLVIDGVESDGMLASGQELGVNRDHSGIIEVASFDLKPDWIIEIDNKSLTHRPDLWGHYGMSREVAAITGSELRDPVTNAAEGLAGPAAVKIEIEDYSLCPRYSALVFDNVTVQPSPLWLQYRLEAIGLNPINNIVDVTNFVMAELAQPMHAFDAGKLYGDTIYARLARAGEKIEALNGETYDLAPTNLVIADASGPIAIAGVIGGNESAIDESTKRIVLESANFQASSVRKTSSALKLRTDASMRFEKSQDPLNTVRALDRAVELLRQVSPGIEVRGGLADAWEPKPPPAPIALPLDWLNRKIGVEIAPQRVRQILESLGFEVAEAKASVFRVTPPSWRATKDISIKDDLVEEVGRMIGYDSIPPRPPMVAASVPPHNEDRAFHHRIRDLMVDQGFTEVYNYSFISDAMASQFGLDPGTHIRVTNPIAEGQNLLRSSLIPGILRNIQDNRKHFDSFRLFEIGHEIHRQADGLPDEIPHLIAALYTKHGDGVANLFELKRVAECLLPGVDVHQTDARPYEHPARSAAVNGIGRLFEVHPSLVEHGRAALLDIDLRGLFAATPKSTRYAPIRRFPTSAFDLSVITNQRKPVGDIQRDLRTGPGNVIAVEFVREYSGPPLAAGTKSISFRVTLGAADRTLSSEEIADARTASIERLRTKGYELRV